MWSPDMHIACIHAWWRTFLRMLSKWPSAITHSIASLPSFACAIAAAGTDQAGASRGACAEAIFNNPRGQGTSNVWECGIPPLGSPGGSRKSAAILPQFRMTGDWWQPSAHQVLALLLVPLMLGSCAGNDTDEADLPVLTANTARQREQLHIGKQTRRCAHGVRVWQTFLKSLSRDGAPHLPALNSHLLSLHAALHATCSRLAPTVKSHSAPISAAPHNAAVGLQVPAARPEARDVV